MSAADNPPHPDGPLVMEAEDEDVEVVLDVEMDAGSSSSSSASAPLASAKGRKPQTVLAGTNSLERLEALLAKTQQFASFFQARAGGSSSSSSSSPSAASGGRKSQQQQDQSRSNGRPVATEREEDEAMLRDGLSSADGTFTRLTEQPAIIKGQLRDYQLEALNWMLSLHVQNLNGILADEMGLGKTLETISLLGTLKQMRPADSHNPHIVIVPKSTLTNWKKEFTRFCPSLSLLMFHGNKEERQALKERLGTTDVCITTYEIVNIELGPVRRVEWDYVVIDEAHRIKNEDSKLSASVRALNCRHRLLITGTPLQNNLHELWALLNFLIPEYFESSEDFDAWFDVADPSVREAAIRRLHTVLRPFVLRRLKSDVETELKPKIETMLHVGLSEMQRDWYLKILNRDIDALNGPAANKMRLLNIVMQLRKVVNHPYLFHGAEPGPPYLEGEHLVENSAKLQLLDKLLSRLKKQGSRVLIFSQMTRVLDILEDYLRMRGYGYARIDGNTKQEDRDAGMEAFNAPGSPLFCFLLSTRAGGLGINLQTADTVILYDSDWNPQMDLQAQDRAHRIGQKKQVHVYRLVTENTIEEKIVERAMKKLYLDAVVIKEGRLLDKDKGASKDELQNMVRFGADRIFQGTGARITDEDIDAIISRGQERTDAQTNKLKALDGSVDLLNFSLLDGDANYQEFEGQDYSGRGGGGGLLLPFIEPPSRERKPAASTYNINAYYREALRVGPKPSAVREFRPSARQPYQFFNTEELVELERKEFESNQRLRELVAIWKEDQKMMAASGRRTAPEDETPEQRKLRREAEKRQRMEELRAEAGCLTPAEQRRKEELEQEGFPGMTRRAFLQFLKANERFGRKAIQEICAAVEGLEPEVVRRFHKVFWTRHKELPDWQKHIRQIERGEERLARDAHHNEILRRKVARYKDPLAELKLPYAAAGKSYTPEEDRFLVCKLQEVGFGNYDAVREEIAKSWMFRFDWFLKSRSSAELGRRSGYLMKALEKDEEQLEQAARKRALGKRKKRAEEAAESSRSPAAKRQKMGGGSRAKKSSGSTKKSSGSAKKSNSSAKKSKGSAKESSSSAKSSKKSSKQSLKSSKK